MFDAVQFGRRLNSLRKARNLTQMELADLMGVSFQAVSNWERGISLPDIAKLPELSVIFGVRIDDIFSYSHARENDNQVSDPDREG